MPGTTALFTRQRNAIFLTLVIGLASVYMLTYSGRMESSDTRALLDGVGSIVHFGDTLLDLSAWYNYPQPDTAGIYPLAGLESEPLQPLLAVPLFWLANMLPGIGLAHTVWLFNIFISALAGGVIFWYSLQLGYREITGVIAALLFGLGTIIWPYSKTFFREPLALLMIVLAALFIECWRAGKYRSIVLLIAVVLALLGAWWSKEAVIFALPGLAMVGLPGLDFGARGRRVLTALLLILVALTVLFTLSATLLPQRTLIDLYEQLSNITGRQFRYSDTFQTALHSYLLSIGGSVWATSPIVLLAVPGCWLLYHRGLYRYIAVALLILIGFALGYATLRGVYWFGGLSWPPRFLIPVVPFLILAALPAVDRLTQRPRPVLLITGTILLLIYGVWIQLSGSLLPWQAYGGVLPPESGGLGEWGGGLNTVQYLRWVLLPPRWLQEPLDLAWVRINTPLWPMMFGAVVITCGLLLWRLLQQHRMINWRILIALPVIFIVMTWAALRAVYYDPLYLGTNESLFRLLPTLENATEAGDVVLLDNTSYSVFFLNYGKFNQPRLITLSDQPGEQASPEQPAQVQSDNPDALLLKITPPLIQNFAATRQRLWLLADSGPWLPWRVRPVERFMSAHYYPIREISTDPPDPTIRLIEFSTFNAPNPYGFRGAEYLTDLRFGDSIQLTGFTLPAATDYQPGDVLPISLYWQTDEPLVTNYTVAWFLISEDGGRVVQGTDYQPGWGFSPTSSWKAAAPVWDNRALRLPPDLPSGKYELWVRLYQSDDASIVLAVNGTESADEYTAILPVSIDITP